MLKKSLLLLLAMSLVSGVLLMLYFLYEKISLQKSAQEKLETIASFRLYDLDSVQFHLRPARKTMLIYFDSECDYCRRELDDIVHNIDAFEGLDIVLMSSELLRSIVSYRERNQELQSGALRFVKINIEDASKTLGSLVVPQILIYKENGSLSRKFIGETKVEALFEYL